jgi:hypothetical protein
VTIQDIQKYDSKNIIDKITNMDLNDFSDFLKK